MIDPNNLTNFNRSRAELEELALFATLVAGKPAFRMARLLNAMISNAQLALGSELSPFEIVRYWVKQGILERMLRHYGTGQYTRLAACWTRLTALAVSEGRSATHMVPAVDLHRVEALEQIPGIGPKTARLIVLHSHRDARCVPIDTHWIKELVQRGKLEPRARIGREGKIERVVEVTPANYAALERLALEEVDRSGLPAAEYDLLVWRKWNAVGKARAA